MRMLLGKHKEFDRSRPHHIYTYSHNPKRAFFLEHARIFGGWWRGCKFIRIRDGWWWWWLLLWLICFRSFYGDGFTMVARFVSPHLSQPRPFTSILGVSWNFESIIKVKIYIKKFGAFVFSCLLFEWVASCRQPSGVFSSI